MAITIIWDLGETSGIQECKTSKEADKFCAELYQRKMDLIGIPANKAKLFERQVEKYRMAKWSWNKERAIKKMIKKDPDFKVKLDKYISIHLGVSITHTK